MSTQLTEQTEGDVSRFKRWRLEHGLSQSEVADLTGLDKSMVSTLERGIRGLRPATKVRVARRLGARISDLFDVDPVEDES